MSEADAARIEELGAQVAACIEELGAQVAALTAQVAAAVQAEREACAQSMAHMPANRWDGDPCQIIRARGDTSALDAALAKARAEGMEAAAVIADALCVGCGSTTAGEAIREQIKGNGA